jgi:hypothetical protein
MKINILFNKYLCNLFHVPRIVMCELYIVLLMKLRKMVFLFFINLTPTSFFRFFFIIVLGVYYGICKSSYNISNVSYLNSLLHNSLLYLLPPFQPVLFFHLLARVHNICIVLPSTPFPHFLPPPLGTNPHRAGLVLPSCSQIL